MSALVGMELGAARERLQRAGVNDISVLETGSRKGVDNADSLRVLRVRMRGDACELVVAKFRTTPA